MARCIMVFLYIWNNHEPVYLLLKRNTDLGGYWQPVTGFVEEPESNCRAALRELNEETGTENFACIYDCGHQFTIDMNGVPCTVSVFAVEAADPPDIRISYEHTEYIWLPYRRARKMLYWVNNMEALDMLHNRLMAEGRKQNNP